MKEKSVQLSLVTFKLGYESTKQISEGVSESTKTIYLVSISSSLSGVDRALALLAHAMQTAVCGNRISPWSLYPSTH